MFLFELKEDLFNSSALLHVGIVASGSESSNAFSCLVQKLPKMSIADTLQNEHRADQSLAIELDA